MSSLSDPQRLVELIAHQIAHEAAGSVRRGNWRRRRRPPPARLSAPRPVRP